MSMSAARSRDVRRRAAGAEPRYRAIIATRQRRRCCGRPWAGALVDRLRGQRCSPLCHARSRSPGCLSRASASGASTRPSSGACHRRLRLVDRHRQCRHADSVDAAVDPAALARLDQSLRRGDDTVRRRIAGLFPILHLGRP